MNKIELDLSFIPEGISLPEDIQDKVEELNLSLSIAFDKAENLKQMIDLFQESCEPHEFKDVMMDDPDNKKVQILQHKKCVKCGGITLPQTNTNHIKIKPTDFHVDMNWEIRIA